MAFRKLMQLERAILHRLRSIDDPRSNRFVAQIERLLGELDATMGILFLSTPDQQGRAERRDLTHRLEEWGYHRDSLNRLIVFIVFFDDVDRLSGLQDELESLLGIRVDVRTPADLPAKFRAKVLAQAQPV